MEVQREEKKGACYTCGKILPCFGTGKMHTGHYITSGQHPSTRYDLDNLRPQCLQCNYFGSGKQQLYREYLVSEIGAERVEKLETKSKLHKIYTALELRAKAKFYNNEIKKIKGEYFK